MKRQRAASTGPRKKPRLARQDATVTTVVRRELRKKIDWKYTDHALVDDNMTSAGTISSLLFNLTRGDSGFNNFEGNSITPQAILLKYYIHTSEIRNACRVVVFQWFDSVTPVSSGILQSIATGLGPIAPTLVTNKKYIKILYDCTHQIAPTAGGDQLRGEGVTDPVTVYIPGKKLRKVMYNATANTVQTGNLYILRISDDLLIPAPEITFYSRVTFADG